MSSDPSLPSLRSLGGKSRARHDAQYLAAEKFSAEVAALRLKRFSQPFRFADLPVELKKMVYSFHADEVQRGYEIAADSAHRKFVENYDKAREERRARDNLNGYYTRYGTIDFDLSKGYSSESSSESDDADEGLQNPHIANSGSLHPIQSDEDRRSARRNRRYARSQSNASKPDSHPLYKAKHGRQLTRYRRRLANFHVPSLAQVSQEIRQDFLQVVFKEGAFDIVVGSLDIEYESGEWRFINSKVLNEAVQNAKDPNDFLHLRPHVANLLGPATIFQNVRFVVYEALKNDRRYDAYGPYPSIRPRGEVRSERVHIRSEREKYVQASSKMRFQWLNHKLRVRSWPDNDNGQRRDGITGEMVDGGLVLAGREMCKREEFKGFTVADLRRFESLMVNRRGRFW